MINTAIPFEHFGESELALRIENLVKDNSVWQVWFSVRLPNRPEIDIVLLHKKVGMFVIEVKAIPLHQILRLSPLEIEIKGRPPGKSPAAQARAGLDGLRSYLHEKKAHSPFIVATAAFPMIQRSEWHSAFKKNDDIGVVYSEKILLADDFVSEQVLADRLKKIYKSPPIGTASRRETFDMREADAAVFVLNSYFKGATNLHPGEAQDQAIAEKAALDARMTRLVEESTKKDRTTIEELRQNIERMNQQLKGAVKQEALAETLARIDEIVVEKSADKYRELNQLQHSINAKLALLEQQSAAPAKETASSGRMWFFMAAFLAIAGVAAWKISDRQALNNPNSAPLAEPSSGNARKATVPPTKATESHVARIFDANQPSQLSICVQKTCTLKLKVVSGKDLGWALALNSRKNFRARDNVSAIIVKKEYETDIELADFLGKTLHIQGRVSDYEGKHQIKIFNKKQLRVIGR